MYFENARILFNIDKKTQVIEALRMTGPVESPPAAARREQMRQLIEQQGFARVSQLSLHFGISEVTVRGDLDALASASAVKRVHGGAVAEARAATTQERAFELSMLASSDEKLRIGVRAAAMVESGQAIVLDVGTTTTAIASALLARTELRDVVIITNALNIALLLEPVIPRFTVVVTGGTLRPLQHSLVDPLAGAVLEHIRADIAFIGCSGVDVAAGVTNINLPEADAKRRMIQSASRSVVVADSTKLGVTHLSRVAPLSEIDTLVTGAEAEESAVRLLTDAGLVVVRSAESR
jgi:DeoR family transcriptional regulator of aga operon